MAGMLVDYQNYLYMKARQAPEFPVTTVKGKQVCV